jgi:hypothetical protein
MMANALDGPLTAQGLAIAPIGVSIISLSLLEL